MPVMAKTGVEWTVTGFAFANMLFWMFRLAAFRKDRAKEPRGFFGNPYDWTWAILNPSNYVPEARLIYGTYLASCLVALVALVVAIGSAIP
jgi:hypothetical protein